MLSSTALFLVPLHLAALAIATPYSSPLINPGQCLQAGGSCQVGSIHMEPFACICGFLTPAKRDFPHGTMLEKDCLAGGGACMAGTLDEATDICLCDSPFALDVAVKRDVCPPGLIHCGQFGCKRSCPVLKRDDATACPHGLVRCGDYGCKPECILSIPRPFIDTKRSTAEHECPAGDVICGEFGCKSPEVCALLGVTPVITGNQQNDKRDSDLKCGKNAINCGTYCTSPTVGCTLPINTRSVEKICPLNTRECPNREGCFPEIQGCTEPTKFNLKRGAEKICPLLTINCPNYDGCFPEIEGCPDDETVSINFRREDEKICPPGYTTCPNYDGCFSEVEGCAA